MTVESSTQDVTYDTDGVTLQYPIPFYFLDGAHVYADFIDASESVVSLTNGTDFTVSGAGDEEGGTLALATTKASGYKLHIYRLVPVTQETSYQQNSSFPAKTTETALDKLTMIDQQLASAVENSIRYPLSEYGTDGTLPVASERANNMLAFDSTGKQTLVPIPASVGAGDLKIEKWVDGVDYISGTSTSVQTSRSYGSKANLGLIAMSTVVQDPASYDLISGNVIQFNAVIPLGVDRIWCIGGTTLSLLVPSDGTVDDDTLSPGSAVYNRAHDLHSIKDGGGVTGNGVTNETVNINAKLAQWSGSEIYFPAGVYIMDTMSLPSNVRIRGAGKGNTIIRRSATALLTSTFIDSTSHDIDIEGITFDGNKANNSSTCYGIVFDTGHYAVNLRKCRVTGFHDGGLSMIGAANLSNNVTSSVTECDIDNNGGTGLNISKAYGVDAQRNNIHDNAADGIGVANYVFPPVNFSQTSIVLKGNRVQNNGSSGISVLGFVTGGTSGAPVLGVSLTNSYLTVDDNFVRSNKQHGILLQCEGFTCNGNKSINNGDPASPIASAFAGIEVCGHAGSVANNYVTANSGYGVDLGGASNVNCHDNQIFSNAKGGGFIGLNVGGVTQSNIHDNILYDNGPSAGGVQIMLTGIDGDGSTPFETLGAYNHVHHNRIVLTGTQIGILAQRQEGTFTILDNQIEGGDPMLWIVNRTQLPSKVRGNIGGAAYNGYTIASASPNLVIPDGVDEFIVTGNTSFSNVLTKSQNDYVGKVLDVAMSNNGSGYTSKPTVSFSGGGGSGAAATAELSNSGRIIGVNMTNNGSGYTSAPSVSFTGGGGSSAAGAAIVGCANSDGREITLHFTGTLTVSSGSNLSIRGGSYSATAGSILKLRCNFGGTWYEVSRN
ncbi:MULTISPECIES: right-handed parallel beta-helix repeat-containing protein [unclassified Caballeronia]|uniref:right-handed parallel beta-helix repeat-containing protein n=1 Tax=unclassified Caballeronia TaxID=2646786 RepID=UPI001F468944|nr:MULTISPECIES: right-handed parallel beta-helix repeat-containing protein [unclassified Caballeronia]MCE4544589.1 right-handed parallel beta-helix repeat-containing protein [Caballeronia sp. PC1]MCE4571741.1 right-handed parallel beta-helix repeat-containing protein [Caballeronia sp. CLC5]